MNKKLIIFFIVLIITAAVGGYWYYQERVFSKQVLKFEILGPNSAKMGEEIEYTLRYKNNGEFTLEDATLTIEFPEHSLTQSGKTRIIKKIGDIYPGQEEIIHYKARLLGKKSDLKTSYASLSYRPKNLSAYYNSETSFTTEIDFVPLTLEFDLPSQLESDKEIQFSVNYFSNLDYTFEDPEIRIEYPARFSFSEATPSPLEKVHWSISSLSKTEGGRIRIKGKFEGNNITEEQLFTAKLGIWKDGNFILLRETKKEVKLTKPLLYISQQINGTSDYVASPGEELRYKIFFKNIGQDSFEREFLIARLEGKAFDLSTLEAELGEANPNDNLIVWDWRQVPELRYLDAQQEGSVSFSIKLKEDWQASKERAGETVVKNKVNVSQISKDFTTKVNSKIEIVQKAYYQNEIFDNSGSIPPKVGGETQYVVMWQLKNYYNDVNNVRVKAELPDNVELTGKIFPEEESSKFSFDSQSREILWVASEETEQPEEEQEEQESEQSIKAGTGILNNPPHIAFQVELDPTDEQAGQPAQIIGDSTVKAEDQWTKMTIEDSDSSIDTTLPDDETITGKKGIVKP